GAKGWIFKAGVATGKTCSDWEVECLPVGECTLFRTPAPASGTARGTPTRDSHADGSAACRVPPADDANGSLRPAHTGRPLAPVMFRDSGGRGSAFALRLKGPGCHLQFCPRPRQGPSLRPRT
ncbi:putative uncharacterized protein C19orf73, partial [Daubentonia madagascariensis]